MQINNLSHESFVFLCLQILTTEFKDSVFAIFKIYPNAWKIILIFHLFRILTCFAASISCLNAMVVKLKNTTVWRPRLRKLCLKARQHLGKRSLCSCAANLLSKHLHSESQSAQQLCIAQSSLLCLIKTESDH